MENKTTELFDKKAGLRRKMSKIRDLTEEADRIGQENSVLDFLRNTDFLEPYSMIYLYASFGSEFPTGKILGFLWEQGKTVLLPRIEAYNENNTDIIKKEMNFYPVKSMSDLKKGYMGILEPDVDRQTPNPDIILAENGENGEPCLMLLPGLAFDKNGGRLGYGGGFYDAFLLRAKNENLNIKTAGLCFNGQIIEEVPMEEKDMRIQGILSADFKNFNWQ